MHRHCRAFTLIENLIAMSLLLLVLGMAWQILAPNLRIWDRSRGRADVEQNSLVLESRMAAELRGSNASSVTVLSRPPGFSFAAVDEAAPYDLDTGRPVWGRIVAYVLDTENHVLYRKESKTKALLPTLPLLGIPLLSDSVLQQLVTTENGTEKAVASYVSSLTVTPPSNSAPIHVCLRYAWTDDAGVEIVDRVLDVQMRNAAR